MKNNKLQHPKKQVKSTNKRTVPQSIINYRVIVDSLPTLGKGIWHIGGFLIFATLILTDQFDASGLELIVTSIFSKLAGK